IPGTLPTRLTTILSLLLPVRTFTALLMVMLSRLTPFTSTSLSPTSRPASSVHNDKKHSWAGRSRTERLASTPPPVQTRLSSHLALVQPGMPQPAQAPQA
uniref:Uncharacterized protein n=1 Tax=Hippocampus comes TaxID=109280 RepID=A0A3Q2YYB2_HIPCM